MAAEDVVAYQFMPGKSGNPNGRPRAITSEIIHQLTEAGYTPIKKTEVADTFMVLLQLPEDDLKRCVEDKNLPMFIRITAKELLSTRGFEAIEKILDRVHGRPTQKINGDIKITEQPMLPDAFFGNIAPSSFEEVKPE